MKKSRGGFTMFFTIVIFVQSIAFLIALISTFVADGGFFVGLIMIVCFAVLLSMTIWLSGMLLELENKVYGLEDAVGIADGSENNEEEQTIRNDDENFNNESIDEKTELLLVKMAVNKKLMKASDREECSQNVEEDGSNQVESDDIEYMWQDNEIPLTLLERIEKLEKELIDLKNEKSK